MKYKRFSGNGRTIHKAVCERCEMVLKEVSSVSQRYCPDCKKEVDREKSKKRMRRMRERRKA